MKYLPGLLLSLFLLMLSGTAFATNEDTQIIDAVDERIVSTQTDQLKFTTFESCDEMETILEDYIKDNFKNGRGGGPNIAYLLGDMFTDGPEPMMMADESMESAIRTTTTSAPQAAKMANDDSADFDGGGGSNGSSVDFSTTNTQKTGIDEADILKSTGEYLYYYNQKEHKVHVIKSPLHIASQTVDLRKLDIVTNINLPETFYGIQMYIENDQLILISNRSRRNYQGGFMNTGNQVDVIVYDVSDPAQPELVRFTELDGSYHDSRRIGDKLYVVNQLWMDRYRPMQNWKTVEDVDLGDIEMLPKNIDVAYTSKDEKKNLQIGKQTLPYHISKNSADCSNIHYVLPTKESIEQFGLHPSFTVVNVIDLASTENIPDITTAFGSTHTIHMAQDNLYLTDHFYLPQESQRACPPNARCIMPFFGGGEHTLVHKFNVLENGVGYQDSTLVNGAPINQYSMDQNTEGEFRILTSTWQPERATHLTILDKQLEVRGTVKDIEPGEEFKSSRYMGDKLYLVTFEQTDPLFVIDMKDSANPKIIGELIIPGFSTYLHPYAPASDRVQFLLGLGYDTDLNEWGGTTTEGIKLDLYKIDYNKKDDEGHVAVTQEWSEVRGGQGSQSEALHNPRMFVWNEKKNMLVLPMHLQAQEGGKERCEIELDDTGEELWRECRNDGGRNITTFIGMKAIEVTPATGMKEIQSFDYKELFKQDKDLYNNGRYNTRQLMPRVGYVGDVLYQLNGAFGHFALLNGNDSQQAFLPFSSSIKISPLPTPTTVIDEMTISKCLNDTGWTLHTTEDCRYCPEQAEVFGDYFAKLTVVNCDEDQQICSDAGITGYPTWTDNEGNRHPGVRQLEDLYIIAQCGL